MRIDFYHLTSWPIDRALPKLLERVLQAGQRAVVMAGSEDRIEWFANLLWTYDPNTWLPHGSRRDGAAERQPIWITDREENPNGATVLVLTDGMDAEFKASFARCLDLFDGANEAALSAARARWKTAKAAGHDLHYMQQKADGGWAEAAL
jgi:DNA polymerase-3 subunit chi